MNLGEALRQKYEIALKGAITPQLLSRIAGNTVKGLHDAMVARGEAPSVYQRIVDGRVGAAETTIHLDLNGKRTGVIQYKGTAASSLSAAAQFALAEAQLRSPRVTGQYASAWIGIVDGVQVDPSRIPATADQVTVVNYAPFAQRLEQGGLRGAHFTSRTRRRIRGGKPAQVVSLMVADAVRRQFQGLDVRRQFVSLSGISGGSGWSIPYIRKNPPGGSVLYPSVVISRREVRGRG